MVGALSEAGVAQPKYAVLVVIEFWSVMIRRVGCMQSCVPVRDRLRVIGVRLVEMLLRQRRGEDEPGCQGKSDDRTTEADRHSGDYALMPIGPQASDLFSEHSLEVSAQGFAPRDDGPAPADQSRWLGVPPRVASIQ